MPAVGIKRGTSPQTRIESAFPGDLLECFYHSIIKSGEFSEILEQPIREIDLNIVFQSELPVSGRSPVQMYGRFG